MTDAPQTEDSMVAALLREREGYVTRGMDDRVAQVDEQLKLRGVEPPKDDKPAKSADRSTPPKGRRARGTETT
ncbi:hypothetical protein [Streptomyces cylindrosporus]|uniref:Uncharacterized protein n=1 Tax=Streptomyces cylindrosporus TaxID=2927583 RepID=A0ABS9Y4K8_9ACTN|nr:hypothetical protein [Streptomyces cylindrosporus]MCI3272143.1 hypothetical protein [Streptomyces cylindrosporus]